MLSAAKFSVGTDTEYFLVKNDKFVSATKFIKGTKYAPTMLPSGGNIQQDNVSMEFATPPVIGEEAFMNAVRNTLKEAISSLPKGVSVFSVASATFPESELQDPATRMFGCDPDYDAWKLAINTVAAGATEKPFRSCGGHLHLGYQEGSGNEFLLDPMGKVQVVKVLDIVLGIPFTVLDSSEASVNRRSLYGKAGCHRPTDYGVEYRTLSNQWVSSPLTVQLVHSMASDALDIVRSNKHENLFKVVGGEDVVKNVVNGGDVDTATNLLGTISKFISPKSRKLLSKCLKRKSGSLLEEWGI
jgi:hypothetical protein